jgi:hypothetical protein
MAKTFDPRKVFVTFANKLITGFMDGTAISVSRNEDAFTLSVGSDGEVARTANANKSGLITLTLMQTSAANDLLSQQHTLDELTNAGTGELQIKDASGRTLLTAAEAWVKKFATVELGKELGGREWSIECGSINVFVGGN